MDYANSVVSTEKARRESLGRPGLTQAEVRTLRGQASDAFKYLPAEEQLQWDRSRQWHVQDDPPDPVDRWDPESLWGLASKQSCIDPDVIKDWMNEKFGRQVGISECVNVCRDDWREGCVIRDKGDIPKKKKFNYFYTPNGLHVKELMHWFRC